ncbi:hypothetical protein Tco_1089345, partial [Tanacetum coccineum]
MVNTGDEGIKNKFFYDLERLFPQEPEVDGLVQDFQNDDCEFINGNGVGSPSKIPSEVKCKFYSAGVCKYGQFDHPDPIFVLYSEQESSVVKGKSMCDHKEGLELTDAGYVLNSSEETQSNLSVPMITADSFMYMYPNCVLDGYQAPECMEMWSSSSPPATNVKIVEDYIKETPKRETCVLNDVGLPIRPVSDEILGTQSREFRRMSSLCVVPVYLPEVLPKNLSEKPSGDPFGYLRRHVPPVSCDQLLGPSSGFFFLQVRFVLLSFILLTFPFPLHHMSFGSQTVGDAVVPKFDMHVYTSVLTSDKVKNLVSEYVIPLNLHPCVPPTGLTMNRLPVDKIACGAPSGFKDGEGTVATSMSQFLKFLLAGGVCVGKGIALVADEVIPQHTTQHFPSGSQIPEKSDHQKVVEYENERGLAAKRKTQAARDKTTGKRSAAEGTFRRTKKKKGSHLTFTLDESEGDDSTALVLEHTILLHLSIPSFWMMLTLRPTKAHRHASGSSGHVVSFSFGGSARLAFPKRNPDGDGAGSSLRGDVVPPTLFILAWNLKTHSILNDAEFCQDMMINLATPAARDQHSRLSDYQALQRSWFELGRGALAQINLLQWYKALNDDYGELYESQCSSGDILDRLTETQNQLVDVIQNQNQLADENKTLRQEHLGCAGKEAALAEKLVMVEKEKYDLLDKSRVQEDRIKHLEEALASKTSSLSEAESVAGNLKGDLERLTLDLSHAEIVRHNYVRHLLPTVFQRLLSNDEYKKSLSDVFNQAIAAGWSEGVKVERSMEDAEEILSAATDYDPECKATFMSALMLFLPRATHMWR